MTGSQACLFILATAADEQRIGALVRAAYAKWVPVIGREPRPMLADYAAHLTRHRFDLVEDAGGLIGLIETVVRDDHLWIENVAVHPDFQGRGLGRRLLAWAEALAQAADRNEMRLLTNAAFAENIALYERIGYRVTHSEPFGSGTTIYMSKTLAA